MKAGNSTGKRRTKVKILRQSKSPSDHQDVVIENLLANRLKKSPDPGSGQGKLENLLSALELVNKEAMKGGYGESAETKAGTFLKGISQIRTANSF